jgi:hypothetical protein
VAGGILLPGRPTWAAYRMQVWEWPEARHELPQHAVDPSWSPPRGSDVPQTYSMD